MRPLKLYSLGSAIPWRGNSPWDGAPIVAILTGIDGSSVNAKTGPMAQLWIMREDIAPHVAQRYVTTSAFNYTGGCIPYIGIEDMTIPDTKEVELLR